MWPSIWRKLDIHFHSNCALPVPVHWSTAVFRLSFVIFSIFLIYLLKSSAAACYLVSNQQTRQFSNKLNFISAQLIINFSPRMLWAWWHGTEGKTPSRLPPYDTQWILWCVISPAYGYFPCDFCWRILGDLFGEYSWMQDMYAFLQYRMHPTHAMSHMQLWQWKQTAHWCI